MGAATGTTVGMLVVQLLTTGMMLLSKLVLNKGSFVFALLAYRNFLASMVILPFAIIFERDMKRKLSLKAVFLIFLCAMFGISMAMGLYYYGLKDTTAGFSSNLLNLIPVITFVLGVITRMEKLGLKSRAGKIKIIATLICVGGAMIVSLYKGIPLHIWPTKWLKDYNATKGKPEHYHWLRGTLLLVSSCFSYAFWFITQGKLFKVFPSKYWTTTLMCLAGSFQTALVGVLINREKEAWMLKWDLQLLTIIYSGVFNSAATFCLISWVIGKHGPLYPSMFNSLAVITTTILDSLLMAQDITVGSLLGMTLIILGLYAFLWAKGKELQAMKAKGTLVPASEELESVSVFVPNESEPKK